jgi:polar amino acid transport system substrate-binding protein
MFMRRLHIESRPTFKQLFRTGSALVACLLILCVSGCAPEPDEKVLRVGMELAYPPFEMRGTDGAPSGVSVEIAKALGESLGREVIIENLAFDGLIPSLKTGKIDLIISSLTATPKRAESIDFSDSYLKTGLCLLVGKDSSVQSFEDLVGNDGIVAVKNGTTGHQHAVDHLPIGRVLVLDSESSCVLEVVQGKAVAFIYDQMSVYKNWKRNEDTTRAILTPFQEESWAIGVRKGRENLLIAINVFLRQFGKGGGFEKLGDQFLHEQKVAFQELGVPFYF